MGWFFNSWGSVALVELLRNSQAISETFIEYCDSFRIDSQGSFLRWEEVKIKMQFKYRIATAISAGAIMMNLMAPAAFASTTVDISGNGKKSSNTANVTNNSTVNVTQNNSVNVSINISAKANSGGNKANGNTGGDVSISTGNANATSSLNVTGGSNIAVVDNCGCENGDDSITISNNGKKSDNKSILNNTKNKKANQTGKLNVTGSIKSKAKSGKNKANDNTNGTVDVDTGNSTSQTIVDVTSGANVIGPEAP